METYIQLIQDSWGAAVLLLMMVFFLMALAVMFWMDWRWRCRHNLARRRRNEKIWCRAAKHGVV